MWNPDLAEPVFRLGITIKRRNVVKPSVTADVMAMPTDSIQRSSANASADPSVEKVFHKILIESIKYIQ